MVMLEGGPPFIDRYKGKGKATKGDSRSVVIKEGGRLKRGKRGKGNGTK